MTADDVFCCRCRCYHATLTTLDADGFTQTTWLELHLTPREVATEGLLAAAGSAFAIVVETGHFDIADELIERSLGALFDPKDPDDAQE